MQKSVIYKLFLAPGLLVTFYGILDFNVDAFGRRRSNASLPEATKKRTTNTTVTSETLHDQGAPSAVVEGFCPQLSAAHEYIRRETNPDKIGESSSSHSPLPSVLMVQLVGTWEDSKVSRTMQKVYEHNSKIMHRHGIRSLAITSIPNDDGDRLEDYPIIHQKEWSPAYWKMNITRHLCTDTPAAARLFSSDISHGGGSFGPRQRRHEVQPPPDLIYFLDADIVLMDPTARVDALWMYLRNKRHHMDMVFASDHNGLNSGSFLVNCSSSQSAMEYLRLWDLVALDLKERNITLRHGKWNEQTAPHYMRQSDFWTRYHEPNNVDLTWDSPEEHEYYTQKLTQRIQKETSIWGNNDNYKTTIRDHHKNILGGSSSSSRSTTTMTASIPSSSQVRRDLVIAEPCALHTIVKKDRPQRAAANKNALYMPGHYAAHAAGLFGADKLSSLESLLEQAEENERKLFF